MSVHFQLFQWYYTVGTG